MLTLAELKAANINEHVAREAYEQASKRLADQIAIKESYERKALALFSGYITLSLALFSAGAVLMDGQRVALPLLFLFVGIVFIVGSVLLVLALSGDEYGVVGSDPEMWLSANVIDGGSNALPKMLAYITHHHKARIDKSVQANDRKAVKIYYSVWAGVGGASLLALYFACQAAGL